jgi:hypothetical protein
MQNTEKTCFEQLHAIVSPHLIHYREDLDQDQIIIEKFPAVPFLHWTRKTGTTIALLFPADSTQYPAPGEKISYLFGTANREELSRKPLETAQCLQHQANVVVCYFDGDRLTTISPDKAVQISQDYAAKIQQDWKVGSA